MDLHHDIFFFLILMLVILVALLPFFFFTLRLACGWVKKCYMEGQEAFYTSVSPSGHQGRTRTRAQRHSSFCWFIVHFGLVTLCFGVN